MAGVQMLRGRIGTILAAFTLMVGGSLLIGAAAQAHTPDGWSTTDLLQGNTTQVVAGTLSYLLEDGTVSIHWDVNEEFEGEVTDQFVCIGSYPATPPADRCKPGQAPEGTVFHADPIDSDDWSFAYEGDVTAFQLHLSIGGETLVGGTEIDPPSDDDGSTDDGSTDDGSTDDGSVDDGSTDDGSTDDGSTDDGSVDDGSTDDGVVVEGNVITKPKPKPEVEGNVLAQTGPETTVLSIIGSLFLMLGLALRFGVRPAAASSQGQVTEALRQRTRGWNCAR